jgi:hypothetical protein
VTPKHIWEWDKKSEKPVWVICARCGRHERLDRVLSRIGCEGCIAEVKQGSLFDEKRGPKI